MTHQNEETADVGEPTEKELRLLACWAHDLGTILHRNDSRLNQRYLERLALGELETRADYCPIPTSAPRVRAIWCKNFLAGWHTAAWDDIEWFEAPTIDIGDYVPLRGEELH